MRISLAAEGIVVTESDSYITDRDNASPYKEQDLLPIKVKKQ